MNSAPTLLLIVTIIAMVLLTGIHLAIALRFRREITGRAESLKSSESTEMEEASPLLELRDFFRSKPKTPSQVGASDQVFATLRDAARKAGLPDPLPEDVKLGIMWGASATFTLERATVLDTEEAVLVITRFAAES